MTNFIFKYEKFHFLDMTNFKNMKFYFFRYENFYLQILRYASPSRRGLFERLHLHHNWLFTFQHNSFTTSSFFQANKHKKASFQQNAAFEEMKTFSRRPLLGFEKCTYSASCSYHFHGHSHADECLLGPFCWSVALLWTSEFSLIEVTIFNKRMPHKTFVTVVCR